MFGWDWSQTTHEARGSDLTTYELAQQMVWALAGNRLGVGEEGGKGIQGWAQSTSVYDAEGYRLGRVYFGGDRTDVYVVSTSDAADVTRNRVVTMYGAKTSRVDTRVDTLMPYEDLEQLLREAGDSYGSKLTLMESEVRGESCGRTVYLGSPSSAIRVRVYEKWLESPGQYVEGTNRVEVQYRPPSRAKGIVSWWEPVETFCASRVTRALAESLTGRTFAVEALRKHRGRPDVERSVAAMGEQYSGAVARYLELAGGDLDAVGRVLGHLGLDDVVRPV